MALAMNIGDAHTKVEIFRHKFLMIERALAVNGALSVDRTLTLSRNTVVESPFNVTITAGPADWATAASVAHIRQRDISGGGQSRTSVIVDFGVMQTISGVGLTDTSTFQVLQVKQWAGTAFAPTPIISGLGQDAWRPIDANSGQLNTTLGSDVMFPSEVRTDRLQIDLIGQDSDDTIGSTLLIQLPDPPADLDLRINGGAPVWRSPGAVTAGSTGWAASKDGLPKQQVDISAALNALLGDPAADKNAKVDLHIVLAARNPGALKLDFPEAAARQYRYLAKVALTSDTLTFATEGALLLPLKLPDYAASVERITFGVTANLPPERVMPPVGPDPALTNDGKRPLAEMLLDATHAACVELLRTAGFAELTALRFPFRVEAGGAEVQVVLLHAAADTPGKPIDGAVTKPITLDASEDETWTTFALSRPLTPDDTPLYAMAVVRRGRVRWALTNAPADSAGRVFTGSPTGPWQELPPLGQLAALRGRVRMVAHAKRESPVAPIVVRVDGANGEGQEISPTPKGVSAEISGPGAGLPATPGPGKMVKLQITSRVAGSITLRDVVVTVADQV